MKFSFSNELLGMKMNEFLRGMEYINTDFIGTVDKDFVYSGFEWCNGEASTGKILSRKDTTVITGGNVFSFEAKKAVAFTKDKELMQLMQDVENFKKIPFPIKTTDTLVIGNKSHNIFSIKAKYSLQDMRVPISIKVVRDGRVKSSRLDEYKLTECMANFMPNQFNLIQTSRVIRFSTGNYIKPLIIHKGKEIYGFDCAGVYKGTESDTVELQKLGRLSLAGTLLKNGYLSDISNYLGLEGISALMKLGNWICPIGCGDEHHVYLDSDCNVVSDTDVISQHEALNQRGPSEREQASTLVKLEEQY